MTPDLTRPPFDQLVEFADLFASDWATDLAPLNALAHERIGPDRKFVFVDPLAPDGLHYEQRIAERGEIAMRPGSWHDFYGALEWLAFPHAKRAINACQIKDLALVGPKQRTRHQQAITHVDEAGLILACSPGAPLMRMYEHDWAGLLFDVREEWQRHTEVFVLGHSLFEIRQLRPHDLLAAKVLPVIVDDDYWAQDRFARRERLDRVAATGLLDGRFAADPKDLPTLPLSAIVGWDDRNADREFVASAQCFRPKPAGRVYAPPVVMCSALPSSMGRAHDPAALASVNAEPVVAGQK